MIYDRGLASGGTSGWLLVGFGFLASACAQEPVGERASAIVGGAPTYEYPAVVILESAEGGYCTGTLVARNVVLTAAHCQVAPDWIATVMSFDEPVASDEVVAVVSHRYHKGGNANADHDISLARLAHELPAEPLPFVTAAFDQPPLGATILGVGFGADDGVALTGGGVKRVGTFSIAWATADYLVGGEYGASSVCYGDSGGPALLSIDGVLTVVGVTTGTGETCRRQSWWTRVDTYAAEFLTPFVDAWSGPCQSDGRCVTEGCRTPDPDCAPCGVDGVCSAGCDALDLDCPLAGFFGDACSSSDDCESRLCVEGGDGEETCSQTCDGVDRFCPSGYRCEPADGTSVCVAEGAEGCGASGGGGSGGATAGLALLALLLSRPACSRGRRRRRRCPGIP